MDLDALGLGSTFDSSGLDDNHSPKVDVVDTSDIEGPEDFTMNMTYWMTADLPLAQIKSRKEAREDTRHRTSGAQGSTVDGDKAPIEDAAQDKTASVDFNSASPTVRANASADGHQDDDEVRSESSMENDKKVMSYLSALLDTDMPGAITSTPLKLAQGNTLQVPTQPVSKARSLQATVEDYDTPRKTTQETVIHHILEPTIDSENTDTDALRNQVAELQSRLNQQEMASKTRITELETILSYTRSELDASRTEVYKQKEQIISLREEEERRIQKGQSGNMDVEARINDKERELNARMDEFGEELRLQNLAKLQNQREDFERQLIAAEDTKRRAEEQAAQKDQVLAQMRSELDQIRQSRDQELQNIKNTYCHEQQKQEQESMKERQDLEEKLSSLQTRAESLQSALRKATEDAKSARQETDDARDETSATVALHSTAQISDQTHTIRITELETRLRSLQHQLDSSREDVSSKDQQILRNIEEQERLDQRLNTAQGRIEGLETTILTLRQQLSDAHRESSKARTDVERFERDLVELNDRLDDARREADRRTADVEKKLSKMKDLKADAEARFKDLQSEHESLVEDHEAQLDDVRSKAEDAVRKAGAMLEAERSEKKRVAKELKSINREVDRLRSEAARKLAEEEENEQETSILSSHSDSKDVEIENLRMLLRKQASTIKTLKFESVSLRKKNHASNNLHMDVETLRHENDFLRSEMESLKSEAETQRLDFEAVNKAMDERLAATLSKMLKERSKNIVGKRDEQWIENVAKLKNEKDFMGKVLMREWGRQECGVVEEKENQTFRYQFVQRS